MSITEVLPCPILSPPPPCSPHPMRPCCSCRPCWPPNGEVVAPAGVGARWAATGRRCSCCAGFSTAPGWPSWPPTMRSAPRPPTAICTRASTSSPPPRPGCAAPLLAARAAGHTHVQVDGTLIRTDRCSVPGPTLRRGRSGSRVDLWWSGKHTCHGGNVQVVTAPDGWPIWTSPVRPGREHDTTCRRAHAEGLPALAEWTDETHAVLGDLGYEGEQAALTTPVKKATGRPLTDDERTVNALHAATRALAERGNSLLKVTLKALRRVSLCPWRIGAITAAALVLLHHIHRRARGGARKEQPMPEEQAVAALATLDRTEMEDRRTLGEARAAPAVPLWETLHRLHQVRVLDLDAEPETAPS